MLPLRNLKRFLNKAVQQPGYAFAVGYKRMLAYFAYFLGRGKSPAPEAITFFLTRLCNLSCKMCGQWGDYGITKQKDIREVKENFPLDVMKKALDEVSIFKPNITLFGGEPFMHPQIMEIIKAIKQKGLHCLVITNGTMLRSCAQEVVELGLDELNVSLDGDRSLHDEIRGLPGVFDRIMSGLTEVNRFKKALKKSKPLINIQCTITKYNYDRLEVLLGVAKDIKAHSLTFHHLIFLSNDLIERQKKYDGLLGCSSKEWEGFVFEPGIEPVKLFNKMKEIFRHKRDFNIDFYPNFSRRGIDDYYRAADYLPSEYAPRCLSPWVCAYIFPEGEVRPCLNCSYSLGNIIKTDFLKIWNSPQAILYRQTLKKEGIFPVCRRCTELYRY